MPKPIHAQTRMVVCTVTSSTAPNVPASAIMTTAPKMVHASIWMPYLTIVTDVLLAPGIPCLYR